MWWAAGRRLPGTRRCTAEPPTRTPPAAHSHAAVRAALTPDDGHGHDVRRRRGRLVLRDRRHARRVGGSRLDDGQQQHARLGLGCGGGVVVAVRGEERSGQVSASGWVVESCGRKTRAVASSGVRSLTCRERDGRGQAVAGRHLRPRPLGAAVLVRALGAHGASAVGLHGRDAAVDSRTLRGVGPTVRATCAASMQIVWCVPRDGRELAFCRPLGGAGGVGRSHGAILRYPVTARHRVQPAHRTATS
jgi:hypothetical protein